MVFFFTYVAFEVPGNIMLKLLRPSTWIMIMMLSWGLVMTLQGIVQSYEGLIVTRLMLGVCEAGFFPAAAYTITTWYCRFEVQSRLSVFYSASAMAGGFSGILAYGESCNSDGEGLILIDGGRYSTYGRRWRSDWLAMDVSVVPEIYEAHKADADGYQASSSKAS